jgi:radical SAM-linked protein
VESLAEHLDVELTEACEPENILQRAGRCLPDGVQIRAAWAIDAKAPSIDEAQACIRYEIDLRADPEALDRGLRIFDAGLPIMVRRERKGKVTQVDARPFIASLASVGDGVVGLTVISQDPALRISEILQGLLGVSDQYARTLRVRKIGVEWK